VSVALDTLKWIADTLLSKRSDSIAQKTARWNQVADYLDSLATIIDATVQDFQAARIPYSHYSQLYNLGSSFENVLWQVYERENVEDRKTVRSLRHMFYRSVHLIEVGDEMVLEAANTPDSQQGKDVLADLQSAAGRFRALAMTLRATA
jgi:hypothetical protein